MSVPDARMRLRYDRLALRDPVLFNGQSTITADWARGCDGIATALEADLGRGAADDPPPGGLIKRDAQTFWKRCVQDRCEMSPQELREQRARDIKKVKKWCKEGRHPEKAVRVYYALDVDISFPGGPIGGRNPLKNVVKQEPKADTKLKRKREHVVDTMTTAVGQGKRRAATETAISKGKQRATASDGIAGSSTMLLGLPSPTTPTNTRRSPPYSLPPTPKLPGLPPSIPDVLAASPPRSSLLSLAPFASLQGFVPALERPRPSVISIASTPEPAAPAIAQPAPEVPGHQVADHAAPGINKPAAQAPAAVLLTSSLPEPEPGVSRSFPLWTPIDQLALDLLKNESTPAEIRGRAAEALNTRFRYCQMLIGSQSSDSGYNKMIVSTALGLLECTGIPVSAKEGARDYLLALLQAQQDTLAALMP